MGPEHASPRPNARRSAQFESQRFDLSTSSGKLMRTIMAGMAEFERDLIRERVKSGIDVKSPGAACSRFSKCRRSLVVSSAKEIRSICAARDSHVISPAGLLASLRGQRKWLPA
jgi:hypothetical protein